MKELQNWQHPFFGSRSVKSWEVNGKYLEITDVRDIFHGLYFVSIENEYGGLDDIYSNTDLNKCINYINKRFK